jgi:putative ABC transport system permease protein
MVTEGYFDALSIPLIAGRTFTERDDASAPEVVVVDESLAQRYWPGKNAVGQQVNLTGRPDSAWATVIGVVGHVHSASLSTIGEPQIYLAARQRDEPRLAIAIRASGDPLTLAGPVRATVRAVDPDVPVGYMRPLADLVHGTSSRLRFNLTILAIFAATALALAAIGIYGVMSQLVMARAREMGIRLALGAQARDVVALVLRYALGIAAVGALAGTLAALASSRAIASLLFGIQATDPVTFVAVPLVLLCATLLAVWAPARRAGRADPLVSLRAD